MRNFNEVKEDLVKEEVKRAILELDTAEETERIEKKIDDILTTTEDMNEVEKLVIKEQEIELKSGLRTTIDKIHNLENELIAVAKKEFIKRNMFDADLDKIFHECEINIGIRNKTVEFLLK